MPYCINVKDLSKEIHNKKIVRNINFHVEQGQLFAFLGPNGAGKSTTMNMLSTLLKKTSGSIHIDDLNMDYSPELIREKIGVVFQEDVLDGDLTVYQNLVFRGGLYIQSNLLLQKQIQSISKELQMEKFLYQKYRECSGGQKRLAQIARALIPNPRLLILDEPTTGLDPVTRKNVWDVLLALKTKLHITLFYTTHYMEEASYADILCILEGGHILFCAPMKQIKKNSSEQSKTDCLNNLYFQLLEEKNKCGI